METSKQQQEPPSEPTTLWERIRSFRLPEGQLLVWWMIDNQRGALRQIAAFFAFWFVFHYVFQWSWSMAFAMLISMFLHECGHAFVFWLARIRFVILYLFPLGAVAAPVDKEENTRSDLLHWNTISWLLQAGPAVNVALILIFYFFNQFATTADPILRTFALDMVYVNGLLASMNLVPVWTLDAGQLFKILYSSLEEHEDNWLTGILISGSVILLLAVIGLPGFLSWATVITNTFYRFGWIAFIIIFTVGVLNQQGRDNPLHAYSKQATNNTQVFIQLLIYITLAGITLWISVGPLF